MAENPRLPLVERDQASLPVRALYPTDHEPSGITKALAIAPDTLAVLAPLLGQVMNASTVDLATKEVVVLRVSALNACEYCVPTHEVVARFAGLPAAAVRALSALVPAADVPLGPREQTLVAFCDRLVIDANAVDDDLLAQMRVHFADHEVIELMVLAGAITTLNYVATTVRVPLDATTRAAL